MKGFALAVLVVLAVGACQKKADKGGPGPGRKARAFPVDVVDVESRLVEYTIEAVGSVAAFEDVQVTARVSGVVDKVRFTEGQWIDRGAILVEIEPERYRLAVKAAQAALERAQASKAEAEAGFSRREDASRASPGLIPGEEVETWRTKVKLAAAEVAQAKVAAEQARLNLADAYVRAPMGGAMQTRTVKTGQYVQPGAVLGTLVRRDPLLCRFEVPGPEAARLKVGLAARFRVRGDAESFSARITHVAASADERSRMVAITAQVDDPRKDALRPGAFAEISVPIGAPVPATLIPQLAVRPSERGFLAYVIEGNVAKERVLTLGMRTADGLVEVRQGLKAGEKVVTRGAEALRDGAQVQLSVGTGTAKEP